MTSPEPVLLYLCYGRQEIYDQAIYSILSLMRVAGDPPLGCRIVVYCDRPSTFAGLPVDVVHIEDATLERWLDGGDYVHRRKTCAIIDALDRFGGKVVFIDTDTYFTRPPASLFHRVGRGRACFHIREGCIRSTATMPDRALVKQLEQGDYRLSSGAPVIVEADTPMWNTGIVAIDATDIGLVREALSLSDAIWAGADPTGMDGKKIHHGEQFAMGYAFRHCALSEAADLVYHYWPYPTKAEFAGRLPTLVRAGLADRSPATLDMLYAQRPRERGFLALKDTVKMQVRRTGQLLGVPLPGVRRSVA
ncbi:hypothetical protein [Sphingomonas bacterium]|uniref:hypothetical protein n=1 Tax=Sphingomonas bacterium TaxID=1895847 RepID=UPI001576339E|nr:hypothetical protein [Sphingomonas bacterium]